MARARRYSTAHQQFADSTVDRLLAIGVFRSVPSNPNWSAIHVVPKGDGGLRLTPDYRSANLNCLPQRPPPFEPDLAMQALSNATVFGIFDLCEAFFQVGLHPDSQPMFGIFTSRGIVNPTRTQMGMLTSSNALAAALRDIFQPILGRCLCPYADDLLLFGPDIDSYLDNLTEFLDICIDRNVYIKATKFVAMLLDNVPWAGYILGPRGRYRRVSAATESLMNLPLPTTVADLQAAVGILNFERDHITGLAVLLRPFHDIIAEAARAAQSFKKTKLKNVPIVPTPELAEAWRLLLQACAQAAALYVPEPRAHLLVYTDASDTGFGSIVTAIDPAFALAADFSAVPQRLVHLHCGVWRHADRTLFNHVGLKEFLAVADAFRSCFYLRDHARGITVLSDHKNLRAWIGPTANFDSFNRGTRGRLERLIDEFASYPTFDLRHVAGPTNVHADFLSRVLRPRPDDSVDPVHRLTSGPDDDPTEHTLMSAPPPTTPAPAASTPTDPGFDQALPSLLASLADHDYVDPIPTQFTLDPNLNIYRNADGQIYVPPGPERTLILSLAHGAHHYPARVAWTHLRRLAYWPGVLRDLRTFIEKCNTCHFSKTTSRLTLESGAAQHGTGRNVVVSADYADLGESLAGHHVLVVTCTWSGFTKLYGPTPTADAQTTVDGLSWWFASEGPPQLLRTDNGAHFRNARVADLCASYSVQFDPNTAPYHSQATAIVERRIEEVVRLFRYALIDLALPRAQYHQIIHNIEYLINHRCHASLGGLTPIAMFKADTSASTLERALGFASRLDPNTLDDPIALQNFWANHIAPHNEIIARRLAARQRHDAQPNVTSVNWDLGDWVTVKAHAPHKLDQQRHGPALVLARARDLDHVFKLQFQHPTQRTAFVKAADILFFRPAGYKLTPADIDMASRTGTPRYQISHFVNIKRAPRNDRDSRFLCLVRWQDFTEEADTWEPFTSLLADLGTTTLVSVLTASRPKLPTPARTVVEEALTFMETTAEGRRAM